MKKNKSNGKKCLFCGKDLVGRQRKFCCKNHFYSYDYKYNTKAREKTKKRAIEHAEKYNNMTNYANNKIRQCNNRIAVYNKDLRNLTNTVDKLLLLIKREKERRETYKKTKDKYIKDIDDKEK